MTDKLLNALKHTTALLNAEGYQAVNINTNKHDQITTVYTTKYSESPGTVRFGDTDVISFPTNSHSPIEGIIENVLGEICTDCLKDDYMFKNPHFVSLIKAYVEVLVNQYGNTVPITRTLAYRIVTDKLSKHPVYVRNGDVKSKVVEWSDDYNKNNFSFTLEVQNV